VAEEISQRELRNNSGEIMRRLDEGESFVVTRHGVPVGELRPLHRRRFVRAEVVLEMFRGAPHVDYDELRADLDAIADPTAEPRV
jgi:prevent-host-death family protein